MLDTGHRIQDKGQRMSDFVLNLYALHEFVIRNSPLNTLRYIRDLN